MERMSVLKMTSDLSCEAPRTTREDTVTFPHGLPGFESHQEFVLCRQPEWSPLAFLQSAKSDHPRFLIVPVELVDPEYKLEVAPWDRAVLVPDAAFNPSKVSVFFVVSAPEGASPTVNMLAPILIRSDIRIGIQAVRSDSLYFHAMPLALKNSEVD